MKKLLKNKKIIAIMSVVLVVIIALAVVVPMLSAKEGKNYMYGNATLVKENAVNQYGVTLGQGVKFLFNSSDSSFAVASADNSTILYSHSKAAAESSLATVVDIRLRDKNGNSYSMDSAGNCLTEDACEIKSQDSNHFNVVYNMTPADNKDVYAKVSVVFSLVQGALKVSVDTAEIELPKGFFVEKLSIMPGLFSTQAGDKNTFYIVPDGCGAQIDVGAVTEKPIALNMNVYGEDVALHKYSEGAVLPFFAIIKDGFSVNTIIEEGDALSSITCKKAEQGGGYLYNTFTVTPCGVVNNKFVRGVSYEGVVSQTYMVKESEADYNSVAAQVRDVLSKNNYISASLNGKFTDLPFFINVVGTVTGKEQFTTFENAAEITALLKSRGVRDIALRYSGFSSVGLSAGNKKAYKPSPVLGGDAELKSMCKEIADQTNRVYFDANILTTDTKTKTNSVLLYDKTSRFVGYMPGEFSLEQTSKINNNISSAYSFAVDNESAGVCLNDGSSLLYSDLNGKKTRQELLKHLQANVGALSVSGSLMLDYPSVYLAKQADAIFSAPHSASCEGVNGVTAVPVLQIVLHGSVVYGSMPINVSNLSADDALLKCIEYGAVPSFLFTHSSETNISYSSYATQTAKLYSRAKKLWPVMNMKMTSHQKVTDGVYKITYDYSKTVYVNYNPSLVEVNGVMISAKDFIVI